MSAIRRLGPDAAATTCGRCGASVIAGSIPFGASVARHLDLLLLDHVNSDRCKYPTTAPESAKENDPNG